MNPRSQLLRIPVNFDRPDPPQDSVASSKPRFWNGTNIRFEFGFFYAATIMDLTGFDSVTVEIKDAAQRTGLPLMARTISSEALDNSLDLDTWQDGSKTHAAIEFDKTETNLVLDGLETTFWMVVSAIVNPTNEAILTAASLTHVGTLATFTSTTPHLYSDGQIVTITGATPSAYNGDFAVTVISPAVFKYTMLTAPSGSNTTNSSTHATLTVHAIVLGAGEIVVAESGWDNQPPSSVVGPTYLTAAQSDARYAITVDNVTRDANIATAMADAAAAVVTADAAAAAAALKMPLAGGTFTGNVTFAATKTLTLAQNPTSALHAATKQYVDGQLSGAYVPLDGSIQMTGMLKLKASTDPTLDDHAVRRKWITDNYIVKTGATDFTGHVKLFNSSPSDLLHAASKGYVDTRISNLVGAAPSDLDTMEELAAAIDNDASFSATLASDLSTKVEKDGSITMTGHLSLYTGSSPAGAQAISAGRVDAVYLRTDGTTAMTGLLTLSGDPTSSSHATRKSWVDSQIAGRLSTGGGTLSGSLAFSGTTNSGIRVSNLTGSQRTALTPANGMLVYNTTLSLFERYEGGTWKTFASGGGGSGWRSQSGAPSNGDGSDGNYDIDTDDGTIYLKASGAWSVIVGPRLPTAGGTMDGQIVFASSIGVNIGFTDGAWGITSTDIGAGGYSFIIGGGGHSLFEIHQSGDVSITSGKLLIEANSVIYINGNQVVKERQANVPSPAANVTALKDATDGILGLLIAHGLMAAP